LIEAAEVKDQKAKSVVPDKTSLHYLNPEESGLLEQIKTSL